jgi:hypothetical protein
VTGSRISTPGPLSQPAALGDRRFVAGRQQALPSSRVAPMSTCPVPRPRWCPLLLAIAHEGTAAFRCMNDVGFPFPRKDGKLSLWTTTIHISGFNLTACTLTTPGSIPSIAGTHAGSLRTCRLSFSPVGLALLLHVAHRLGNSNEFQKPPFIGRHPLVSGLSWRDHALVRGWSYFVTMSGAFPNGCEKLICSLRIQHH